LRARICARTCRSNCRFVFRRIRLLCLRYNAKLDALRKDLEAQYEQRYGQLRAHEDTLQVRADSANKGTDSANKGTDSVNKGTDSGK
jgi:hypothetical protein